MTTEIRYIMFEMEEVRAAICQYLALRGSRAVAEDAGRLAIGTENAEVVADVHSRRGGKPPLRIPTGDLLQALLMDCRSRRIPLSRLASKKLELTDGRVVLVSGINPPATAARVIDGKVTYTDWGAAPAPQRSTMQG